MFLKWLVAEELKTKPGHFTPMGLFPSEADAKEYLDLIRNFGGPAHNCINKNRIVRAVDSEESMFDVLHGKEK